MKEAVAKRMWRDGWPGWISEEGGSCRLDRRPPSRTAQRMQAIRCQAAGKRGRGAAWDLSRNRESSAHEGRYGRSGTHVDGRGSHLRVWEPQEPSSNGRKATGRGDTDRLLTRGKLRRVAHRVEGDQETGKRRIHPTKTQEADARQTR